MLADDRREWAPRREARKPSLDCRLWHRREAKSARRVEARADFTE